MRTNLRALRASAFVVATWLSLAPADALAAGVDPGAATPVQREQAQSRFLRGRALYESGSYSEAIEEFRASNEIVASPNARLYLARALRESGRLVEAYVELGRAAVEADEHAKDDGRYEKAGATATKEREALAPKLGFITVRVDNATEATTLSIAGAPVKREAWSEPVPVLPGSTEIVVDTPGAGTNRQRVAVAAAERKQIAIDAQPPGPAAVASAPVPSPAAASPEPSPAPTSSRASLRPYAYVAAGVGVAGLATFTIAGLMSSSTYSDLEATCPAGKCPASAADTVSRGRTEQTVANVGLVVGIVGIAAGATLFVLSMPRSGSSGATARVVAGPSSAFVQGTF
jgi:hypothetical protein